MPAKTTKKAAPKTKTVRASYLVEPNEFTNQRGATFQMLRVCEMKEFDSARNPDFAGVNLSVNKWRKILAAIEHPATLKKIKAAIK